MPWTFLHLCCLDHFDVSQAFMTPVQSYRRCKYSDDSCNGERTKDIVIDTVPSCERKYSYKGQMYLNLFEDERYYLSLIQKLRG